MKIAVVYLSETGQTKKVADAIAAGVPGPVDTWRMNDVASLVGYDLVFFGMPMHQSGAPKGVRSFLEQTCTGKKVALFVTHAAPEGMEQLAGWLDNCREAAGCADLVGFFECQAELAESVRQYMLRSGVPMLVEFAKLGDITKGQPDESRLERAREFGREIAVAVAGA